MKKIKNTTVSAKTWVGQEVAAGEYYEIQPNEEIRWANDSTVLSDIGSGDALVNDGASDIIDVNKAINFLKGLLPSEVVTQFEKDDKMLKLACGVAECDGEGRAIVELEVPGTPGSGEGRYIDAGRVWFDTAHDDDKVEKVEIVDVNDMLGAGENFVVRTWHDDDVAEENQGWFIPKSQNGIAVESLGGYGFIPAGFTLRITGKKGSSQTSGKLYVNLKWGKQE